MSEAAEGVSALAQQEDKKYLGMKYRSLVKEAYIDPIRTVIVVDDEFPTLDNYVNSLLHNNEQSNFNKKYSLRNVEIIKNLLNYSRSDGRDWLVDIFDGGQIDFDKDFSLPKHLQHSDLMILDYHLKGDQGSGEDALKILRMLASSNHFNMVAIYTKGYEGEIGNVFNDVVFALYKINVDCQLNEKEDSAVNAILDEIDDFIFDSLIGDNSIILLRSLITSVDLEIFSKSSPWEDFLLRFSERLGRRNFNQKALMKYVVNKLLKQYKERFSEIDYGKVSFFIDKDVNWIRVNTLFVTIINKKDEPDKIPEKILNSLINWQPTPHQLVMSRMRAQMDDYGVHAESGVLRDRVLQAGWLSQFYLEHADDRALSWRNNIKYHWFALGDKIREKMGTFSASVSEYLTDMGKDNVFNKFFMNDFDEKNICLRMNSFNSFKSDIDDAHLMTGHVLKINGDEYWVCMSPACDLVPGQKEGGRFKRMGSMMPFIGVKLYKINRETALKDANSNIHVFMSDDHEMECYSFHPDGIHSASPHWEMLYAENKGRFNNKNLKVQKISFNGYEPNIDTYNSSIVSQFRYEYALNFLNRLGGNLSRVGLDYKNFDISKNN
ncbi:response regulator receiver domain [Comamonas testosteroni]|uniref:response regulator receiver domain n=1 Tax=Comamonas testosteroni TaxID=285 RepID=UPI002E10B875|nr:response regulator receiver domain [Comamonas testosteroni]